MINVALLKDSLPSLLAGASISIQITSLAVVIGVLGGTVLALVLLYGNRFMRIGAHVYTTFFRGTPMLMQIMMLYFLLPYIGIKLPAFWAAVMALGLNSIAYISQIVRGGIQAVSVGQIEAAKSLGLSQANITKLIVLPQAFKIVLPALGNEFITLIKDSSLASVIGVLELMGQGSVIMSRSYDALTVYFGVALVYLCMTSIASLLLHVLERKMKSC